MKKRLLPLTVIAIILVFMVGFTARSKSEIETYANTKYGYEVKYPAKLDVFEHCHETIQFLCQTSILNPQDMGEGFSVLVHKTTLEEEIENIKNEAKNSAGPNELKKEQSFIHQGHKGVMLQFTSEVVIGDSVRAVINNGKYTYSIHANSDNINQVLQNFKIY